MLWQEWTDRMHLLTLKAFFLTPINFPYAFSKPYRKCVQRCIRPLYLLSPTNVEAEDEELAILAILTLPHKIPNWYLRGFLDCSQDAKVDANAPLVNVEMLDA